MIIHSAFGSDQSKRDDAMDDENIIFESNVIQILQSRLKEVQEQQSQQRGTYDACINRG